MSSPSYNNDNTEIPSDPSESYRPVFSPGAFPIVFDVTSTGNLFPNPYDLSTDFLNESFSDAYALINYGSENPLPADTTFKHGVHAIASTIDASITSFQITDKTEQFVKLCTPLNKVKAHLPEPLVLAVQAVGYAQEGAQTYINRDPNNRIAVDAIHVARYASPELAHGGPAADHPINAINLDALEINESGSLAYTRKPCLNDIITFGINLVTTRNLPNPDYDPENDHDHPQLIGNPYFLDMPADRYFVIKQLLNVATKECFYQIVASPRFPAPIRTQLLIYADQDEYPVLPQDMRDQIRTLFDFEPFAADRPVPLSKVIRPFNQTMSYARLLASRFQSRAKFLSYSKPGGSMALLSYVDTEVAVSGLVLDTKSWNVAAYLGIKTPVLERYSVPMLYNRPTIVAQINDTSLRVMKFNN
jgi:hypothetical protein